MTPAQEPAKKIANRVVKKRVIKRPATGKPAPKVRYGHPSWKPGSTPTKTQTAAKATPSRKTAVTRKPSRDLGKKAGQAGKAIGQQTGRTTSAVAGGVKGAASTVGSSTSAIFGKLRAVRLPRMEPIRASAIVGLLVGLITVGVTALFAMMFSELRGTSTGGGRWGSLTVVVVAFIAFAAGEYLLANLHVRQPRLKSFLGVCLTLIAIMALFLPPVQDGWAWLVVPLLAAAAYPIAHKAIAAADSSSTQPE